MSYNAKNYTEQGGDKTVIGGTLEIKEGATVIGLDSSESCFVTFTYNQETEKWSADKTIEDVVELYMNHVPVYAVVDEENGEYFNRAVLHLEYLSLKNGEVCSLKFATSTNWNFTVTVENGEWSVNLPE